MNCRGLGCPQTVLILTVLVRRHRPVILFLIETMVTSVVMENIRVRLGFTSCFTVDALGRSGGLSLLWHDRFDLDIKSYSRYHIDVVLNQPYHCGVWRLTWVYGEPQVHLRPRFWNFMKSLQSSYSPPLPWLCIGDWNEILHLSETQGAARVKLSPIRRFERWWTLLEGFNAQISCQWANLDAISI